MKFRGITRIPTWVFFLALLAFVAFFPSLVAPHPLGEIDASQVLAPPSWSHWLGTDELGGDLLSSIIYGAKIDFVVSAGSTTLAMLLGVLTGALSALTAKPVANAVNGMATGVLAFPVILLGILAVASFGPSAMSLIIILTISFWPQVHILTQAQIRSVAKRDFVTAAYLLDVPRRTVVLRHLIPNSMSPLIVLCPQLMATAILVESGLSYLGLGIQPPAVSWGTILLNSKNYYQSAPWYSISGGLITTITVVVLLVLGDRALLLSRGESISRDRSLATTGA